MKSSLLRVSLAKYLRQVVETGQEVTIEHDSREVAVLSLTPPRLGTPPMFIKISEAQGNWAELLAIVSVRGARFFFKRKSSDEHAEKVYLYRLAGDKSRNCFIDKWNEHRETHRREQEQIPPSAVEKILDSHEAMRARMADIAEAMAAVQSQLETTANYAKDAAQSSEEAKAHSFEAKENSLEAKESSEEAKKHAKDAVQIQRIQFARENRQGHIFNTPETGVVPLRTAANTFKDPDDTDD